ncbi:hypothetical protein PYK22_01591 [Pyrinomonas methylaliphatogenes]|uniref:Uncharacterized protein n=1 Tax=Pyrinomonas methylaliphatogenes TaxID=454194 RepID=A0A0B6WX16_9BACT|nr:hypothetical protein PYK22_01591 [Pyrinomonas methylaliphatogenes]
MGSAVGEKVTRLITPRAGSVPQSSHEDELRL